MEQLESIRAMGPDALATMLSASKKMKGEGREGRFHIQLLVIGFPYSVIPSALTRRIMYRILLEKMIYSSRARIDRLGWATS